MSKTIEKSTHSTAILMFGRPVGDTCEWHGITFTGTGKESKVDTCGAPTVGKGVFCDPDHRHCYAADVCERHKGTAPWYEEDEGAWHL